VIHKSFNNIDGNCLKKKRVEKFYYMFRMNVMKYGFITSKGKIMKINSYLANEIGIRSFAVNEN
jgi:hypothetical protein